MRIQIIFPIYVPLPKLICKPLLIIIIFPSVVELTGDVTPDMHAISKADVIVTTPEKWDGVSRSWQTRNYVQDVALLVIDEIHLLGDERGPVLEVIVSRTNFISSHTEQGVRVVGLSTALANARDLADWLGIKQVCPVCLVCQKCGFIRSPIVRVHRFKYRYNVATVTRLSEQAHFTSEIAGSNLASDS